MVRESKPLKFLHIDYTRWAFHPALWFTVCFFIFPLAVMLTISFWQRVYGRLSATWDIANYIKFFSSDYLIDSLTNSIEVTVLTTVFSILLAYPLAYILAFKVPKRVQGFLLLLSVMPFWTAYVVRSYSWLLVISENGVLNAFLKRLGLIDQPLEMAYSQGATVLGFVHFFTMLITLTIYANLVQIKPSYWKAAADLGAGPVRIFLRITLPLSVPGVVVGAFISFVIAIGDYITPQILGGGTDILLPQAIMLQISRAANFPMASVMAVTLMAVVIIVYAISTKHMKMERV